MHGTATRLRASAATAEAPLPLADLYALVAGAQHTHALRKAAGPAITWVWRGAGALNAAWNL